MAQSYLSLSGECVTQKVIEKSKFIATSRHVCGEEEARAFIAEISKKYSDATHNCYAYISDNLGNFPRFSDDGEPQGTAGMPMLEVLKNNKLYEVAVVVTRYFGGIKLGAGGLVRAYAGAVAENIAAAQKVLYETCSESVYTVDYSNVDGIMKFFAEHGADVISTEYLGEVHFTAAIKKSVEEQFNAALINTLNGRVRIKKLREYFFPFKV
ncbi:MAG: YigZ family protein [Clostridiales bacterium]|nr:YigZ family protein [Clostridiales bacterium]